MGCVHALEEMPRLPPRERVKRLAAGCAAACPGLGDYARRPERERVQALVRGCGLDCRAELEPLAARRPPGQRWELSIATCGAAYYGLPAGAEALLSPEWFVVQRVAAWLAGELAGRPGDGELGERAAAAVAAARFALPLPARAPGLYELPRAVHAAPSRAAAYVRVEPEALTAATLPVAALGLHGATLVAGQGGRLFGGLASPLAAAELPARLRELRADAAAPGDVLLVADQAVPAARLLAAAQATLADPDLVARLGVTTVDGEAGEHTVRLLAAPEGRRGFAVTVSLLDERYSVVLADGTYNPFDRVDGGYDPIALEHFLARHPAGATAKAPLRIVIRGQRATSRDLAELLDAAASAGVRFAVLAADAIP